MPITTSRPEEKTQQEGTSYLQKPDFFLYEKIQAQFNAMVAARYDETFDRYLIAAQSNHLLELYYRSQQTLQWVEIALPSNITACPACKGIEGTVLNIHQEIKNPTLPLENCQCVFNVSIPSTHQGYCRCYYEPVVEEEK